jgi:hypothetical protein
MYRWVVRSNPARGAYRVVALKKTVVGRYLDEGATLDVGPSLLRDLHDELVLVLGPILGNRSGKNLRIKL